MVSNDTAIINKHRGCKRDLATKMQLATKAKRVLVTCWSQGCSNAKTHHYFDERRGAEKPSIYLKKKNKKQHTKKTKQKNLAT